MAHGWWGKVILCERYHLVIEAKSSLFGHVMLHMMSCDALGTGGSKASSRMRTRLCSRHSVFPRALDPRRGIDGDCVLPRSWNEFLLLPTATLHKIARNQHYSATLHHRSSLAPLLTSPHDIDPAMFDWKDGVRIILGISGFVFDVTAGGGSELDDASG
ncbi:hypothetical protein EI94DRAFT_1791112 [Lactarius quietus]|nr:hypothetical protein EI94DRAFT_1791112 [Lactarius quietus]